MWKEGPVFYCISLCKQTVYQQYRKKKAQINPWKLVLKYRFFFVCVCVFLKTLKELWTMEILIRKLICGSTYTVKMLLETNDR